MVEIPTLRRLDLEARLASQTVLFDPAKAFLLKNSAPTPGDLPHSGIRKELGVRCIS